MEKRFHVCRAIVAAATAATLATSAPMSAHASEIQRAYFEHTRLCIRLFFSDQAAHAAQCLPNNIPNVWSDDTSPSPVATPPVPPVAEDDDPPDPGCELDCGDRA